MKNSKWYDLLFGMNYYSINDLRYNQKLGLLFSKDTLAEFLKEKELLIGSNHEKIENLPLITFNSKYCFFIKGEYLTSTFNQYLSIIFEDFKIKHENLFTRHSEDILLSRVFSEIEGSLNVENIPTTHKRINEIYQNNKLNDKNDIIIKNMLNALNFIMTEQPKFNKDNLLKLYNILSENCLNDEDKIKEGAYYRDDDVMIGSYEGANASIIDECMNSLFNFANDPINIKKYNALLPHICHYYILYIHPYFDYNGRTARMVSFWLNYINNIESAPLFISEAINDNKKSYYEAIINTRNTKNDLTYFLGYILETSIKYGLIYKNLEEFKEYLSKTGDSLTPTEWNYLKKIISHNPNNYFGYKDFFEYIQNKMSKAGALKILNHFAEYGILEKSTNKKKEAIYKINQDLLVYKFD